MACERPPDEARALLDAPSPMDRLPADRAGEIVRRSIDFAGGYEAWAGKKTLVYTKVTRYHDEHGAVTREVRQLHRYRLYPRFQAHISWEDEGKRYLLINNGEQAWKYVDGALQTSEVDRNQAWNSTFGSHYVVAMPFKLTDEGVTLHYAGRETLPGGVEAERIDVTYAPGVGSAGGMHRWSYYFDPADARLVANFLDYGDGYSMTFYDAFITVDGITLPAERRSYEATADRRRGRLVTSYRNEEVYFDAPLADSLFEPLR